MAWTEESIIVEFRTHVAYWQEKLRLRDVTFNISAVDSIDGSPSAWVYVQSANCGANPYACDMFVKRGMWGTWATRREVWKTCAHELVHVMNWAMSRVFEPLTDHFAASQINMAKALMKNGDEELAYKWEEVLAGWFKADAPPDTIPPDAIPE